MEVYMLDQLGYKLKKVPIDLVYERTLEFFEGDILTEYRGRKKSSFYIEKLCSSSGSTYRYLLVRADQRSIADARSHS